MNFIIKNKITILGTIIGAVAGYLYFYYIGCQSGTCAITSKPINSSLYGAVLGYLISTNFKK
ncbi:MAG: hypothetical protein KA275_03490 [Chitinophagaceae bacterium]|nr:hypothetical protein [Chitinophagaceae bacterium]